MPKIKNVTTYILRLAAFGVACIVIGVLVLIVAFAPATNPAFLSSVLFRGNNQNDIKELKKVALMFCGSDSPSVAIYDTLASPQSVVDFKKFGLDNPDVAKIKTSDGLELEGWYFAGPGKDTALVCYNGFGKRLPLTVGYIKMLKEAGLSVLLFDYRGLNNKDVKISAQTACIDGQAAYDYLVKVKGVAPDHIVLLGRDIGSYVCLKIAAANKCKALILENPWATVKGFVDTVPGAIAMRMVPGFLYTDDCLNNVHLVGQTHPPILVVSDDPEITDSGNFLAAISPPKSYLYVDEYMPAMLAPDLDQSGPQYGRRLKGIVAGDPLPANEAASVNWQTDYTSAADQAKKNNKPLLVEFGASWCGPCRRMERTTYVDAAVAAKLNNDFVAVKLDSASRDARMLRVKYPFRGIPTVLVFDRGGKLKQTLTGFMGPYQFLNKLSERQ